MISSQGSTQRINLAGQPAAELTTVAVSVTVEEGPHRGKLAWLPGPSLCIGSDASNDLVLTDPAVSRRHAVLTVAPDGVMVEDLESTNGTWLNASRLRSGYATDGASPKVGSSRLKLRVAPSEMVVVPEDEPQVQGMLGRSPARREIFALVRQPGRTNLLVSITGETGLSAARGSHPWHFATDHQRPGPPRSS